MKFSYRIILLASLLCLTATTLQAQTVIDIEHGGVRPKTMDDYREEMGIKERVRADSLAYIDHLTRAFNALHDDSLSQAEELFRLALKTRPNVPGNYLIKSNLGRIQLGTGRYREAVGTFSEILTERPDLTDVRLDRAVCYYELNSLKAAAEDCSVLLNQPLPQETRTRVLFLRSAVYRKSHQTDLAKADLETILEADPINESAQLLLAGSLEELGQPQAALNRLNLYLSAHPQSIEGLVSRAQILQHLGQTVPAVADYDAALKIAPTDASLYIARASLLISLGKKTAARADLDKALTLGVSRGELTELYKQANK